MENTSSDRPRISICCEPGKLYTPESSCYRNVSLSAEKLIFPNIYDANLSISSMSPMEFIPRYGNLECSGNISYYLESYPPKNDLFYLLENGTIYVNESMDRGLNYTLDLEDYCLTSNVTENGTTAVVSVCESLMDDDFSTSKSFVMYFIMIGLSLPFLAATFLVYTILPELKNIHGLILRVYTACLFVAEVLFIVVGIHMMHTPYCNYLVATMVQFWFLATFFWLNVMCFDIWWTFRTLQDSSKQGNRKKFVFYSIYAWGSSALITGVGSIIDSMPTVPTGLVRPGLLKSCWFTNDTAEMIYMDGPSNFTIVCNICFFALTAIKIKQHEKNTAPHLRGKENRRHNDEKQRFNVYLKLFLVMGITQFIDLIDWLWDNVPDYIMVIIDIPNALQGLAIFIIFVWKDKIKRQLLKRLGCTSFRSKNSMDLTYRQSSPSTEEIEMES